MNFTWLNSFFGSHNLKSEMEEQANDLVTDKCQASDKITAIEKIIVSYFLFSK